VDDLAGSSVEVSYDAFIDKIRPICTQNTTLENTLLMINIISTLIKLVTYMKTYKEFYRIP
jgi:hypothetical protein